MADDIYTALTRTALLLERDVFGPGADHWAIIDGLRATTVRIIADRHNIDSVGRADRLGRTVRAAGNDGAADRS